MGGACGTYGGQRDSYRVLVERLEGRRPLGRPNHRWGIILSWNLKKWDEEAWIALLWLKIRTGIGRL
jgi:hypothetical protein